MNCHFIKAFARIATCLVSTVAVGAMALAPAPMIFASITTAS